MLTVRGLLLASALLLAALPAAGAATSDGTTCVDFGAPGTGTESTTAVDGYACVGAYERPSGTRCYGAIVAVDDRDVSVGPCI